MCKINYAASVRINMPNRFRSCRVFIGFIWLYIDDIILFYKKILDKSLIMWYNYSYSIKCLFKYRRIIIMNSNNDSKIKALKAKGLLNSKPEAVKDELFQEHDFFDRRDLLQVKYEMVRRVKKDSWSVTQASDTFGFSRPCFYDTQNILNKEGLPGLIPAQRGPKGAHKLSEDAVAYIKEAMSEDKSLRAPGMADLIEKRFGFKIHPRSIERALEKQKKKRRKRASKGNV